MGTDITVIKLPNDKKAMEGTFRKLWRECFEDPAAYEEFYFKWVYRNNVVYAFEEKGMLHLNPYSCVLGEKERMLHYIVGVGTKHSERRTGIMRNLLKQALQDMYKKGEPFTYLMPADVRYYEPFGFVSIHEKKEYTLCEKQKAQKECCYCEYPELLAKMNVLARQQLYEKMDSMLSEPYTVYAKHDASYFELLYQEKSCQGGNVVFCFQGSVASDNVLGFFAYSVNGKKSFIEQSVFAAELSKDSIDNILIGYESIADQRVVVERFPFMVRITNVMECMKLFPEALHSCAAEGKELLIIDEEIPDNNGVYSVKYVDEEMVVEQQSRTQTGQNEDFEKEMVQLSIAELTERVFAEVSPERVYFAEVI